MPAQTPPCYRWRMVRAGLGIGAEAAALLLTGASLALAAPEPVPETPSVVVLGPETTAAWVFAAALGLGATAQAAGMLCGHRVLTLLGAAAVIGAGVFDQDPVLVVGQLALLAALWPWGKKARSPSAPVLSKKS